MAAKMKTKKNIYLINKCLNLLCYYYFLFSLKLKIYFLNVYVK